MTGDMRIRIECSNVISMTALEVLKRRMYDARATHPDCEIELVFVGEFVNPNMFDELVEIINKGAITEEVIKELRERL